MSRIYFHSPSGDVEVLGAERHNFGQLATMLGHAAWEFEKSSAWERAALLMDSYLDRNRAHDYGYLIDSYDDVRAYEKRVGTGSVEVLRQQRQFVNSLELTLRINALPLKVFGYSTNTCNVELNTAVDVGGDVLALIAKIHGWCEVHCWVDGPDREWLARVIDAGLNTSLFRAFLHGHTTGWHEVIKFLRDRDDEPVVLSYSVTEQFPGKHMTTWERPVMPEDWHPDWVSEDDGEGLFEWSGMSVDRQKDYWEEHCGDLWYDLPDKDKWAMSMEALRQRQPWAQLTPGNLLSQSFGVPINVFDLFADNAADHIRSKVDG